MINYIHVKSDFEYLQASSLFEEYSRWLNIDLSFQKFEEELISLKMMYGGKKGTIILAFENSIYIACVAVRPITDVIGELKRMYVKLEFQKKGIGQELLNQSILFAKQAGYEKIRLDTLEHMTPAMNLYIKNGFYKIEAYYFNPISNAVYFEKLL